MVLIKTGKTGLRTCIVLLLICASACSKKNYSSRPQYHFNSIDGKPDYSNLSYWAAHPYKNDLSDSVPYPLRKTLPTDSSVDVFFIHPTTFTNKEDSNWNASINDSVLNAKTDYSTILYQASAFNTQARVFAPRYRQAHFRAFTSPDKKRAAKALEFAYEDIKRSFEFYLEHYNQGRPIVIAAHSQGTVHAAHLLRDFFENKALERKLICAYLIGMPVSEDYFAAIPPCKDSTSTGCFVSWRSYQKGFEGEPYIGRESYRSIVTNPLTWSLAPGYVPGKFNKGTVLFNFNKLGKGGSAEIHNNILWTAKPRFFGNVFFKKKNYHIADINLFYLNIRENLTTRIRMYWKH